MSDQEENWRPSFAQFGDDFINLKMIVAVDLRTPGLATLTLVGGEKFELRGNDFIGDLCALLEIRPPRSG